MAIEIELDAEKILKLLIGAPRQNFVPAETLAADSALSPERVNDAVAALVDQGFASVLQFKGTAPFDFGDAMVTPRGRRAFQRALSQNTPGQTEPTSMPANALRLFVSHSSEDSDLAQQVVLLLRSALNLPADAIRCTSVDGYRLSGGANTNEQLRREVHDSIAFIGIVSGTSMRSMYVLFELGARWGAGKTLVPLLAPGVSPSVMGGPLAGLNALRADNSAQLHQLVLDIGNQLSIAPQSASAYQRDLENVLAVAPATSMPQEVPVSQPEAASAEEELSEQAGRFLTLIAAAGYLTSAQVAQAMSVSDTKARYLADGLNEKGLLSVRRYLGRASEYGLNQNGRKYVVERGLVE